MPIDSIQKYTKALSLLDAPDLPPEKRDELESAIAYFKQANPYAVVKAHEKASPAVAAKARQMEFEGHRLEPTRMLSSLESMERAGIQNPGSVDEYGQKVELVEDENRRRAEMEKTGRDPGEVLHPETFNEMQSGMVGYEERNPGAYEDYLSKKKAPVAASGQDGKTSPVWMRGFEDTPDGQRASAEEPRGDWEGHVLPSASNVARLYSDPEYVPTGVGLAQMVNVQPWLEPPISLARQATGDPGLQVTDEKYQRFADAMWQEEVEKAKREKRPARRTAYAPTKDWLDKAVKILDESVGPVVGAAASGVDDSLTFGVTGRATGTREGIDRMVEEHPYAYGTGAVIGAISPGGLTGRIFSAITKKAGGKALGRLAGGAGVGAIGSLGTDTVQNLSEANIGGDGGPGPSVSGGDMLKRAGIGAAAGLAGGALGEAIGVGAGKLVRKFRQGELGTDFANLEQAGMTTRVRPPFMSALSKSPEIEAAERAAAESDGKLRTEDVLSNKVNGPVAKQRLFDQSEGKIRAGTENERFGYTAEGQIPRRMDGVLSTIDQEIMGLKGRDGRPMAGQSGAISDLTNWRAEFKASNDSRAAKELSFRELENSIVQIQEKIASLGLAKKDAGPYKRILKSAMEARSKFPKADELPLFKDQAVLKDAAAMKGRHERDWALDIAKNRALGLPEELKPGIESVAPGARPAPNLTFDEDQALNSVIQKARSAKGQELRDRYLYEAVDAADPSGKLRAELNQLPGLSSRQKLNAKSSLRSFFGMSGNLSAYSSSPSEYLTIRGDPIARGLSKLPPEPAPISDELRFLLQRLTGKVSRTRPHGPGPSRALDPLGDIGKARGRWSSGRLGLASGGGSRDTTDEPISREELAMLRRLVDLSKDSKPMKATGGTRR